MFEGELGRPWLNVNGEATKGQVGHDLAVKRLNNRVGCLVWDVGADYYDNANGKEVVEGGQAGVLLDHVVYWFEDQGGGFGAGHRLDTTSVDAGAYVGRTA